MHERAGLLRAPEVSVGGPGDGAGNLSSVGQRLTGGPPRTASRQVVLGSVRAQRELPHLMPNTSVSEKSERARVRVVGLFSVQSREDFEAILVTPEVETKNKLKKNKKKNKKQLFGCLDAGARGDAKYFLCAQRWLRWLRVHGRPCNQATHD